jgi:hypothetical protein
MPTKKTVTKKTAKKVTPKTTAKKVTKKAVPKKAAKKAVKKATKKTSTKNTSTKPGSKKTIKKVTGSKRGGSKKPLLVSDPQTAFWLTDGRVLDSLLALRDAFDDMTEEIYGYHVAADKNDFANWVSAVLCDENCAQELEKAKTPKSAKTVVVRHLKYYVV